MSIPVWRDHALCARHGKDPEPPWQKFGQKYAADYCRGCPVMRECAADALDYGDLGVVRGGVYIPGGASAYQTTETKRRLRAIIDG